jgi:Xaa-Pro aminopeptidase
VSVPQGSAHVSGYSLVPPQEIFARISRFQNELSKASLSGAIILDKINMFYFTGTIQKAALFVPAQGEPVFFIRRSLERAEKETPLKQMVRLTRFNGLFDHLRELKYDLARLGMDESTTPVSMFKKLRKTFQDTVFEDMGFMLAMIRAVKSDYEVEQVREAGRRHETLYDAIPGMIQQGMTEWALGSRIHARMLELGFTGVCRLADPNTELFAGAVNFGESGNYPTASVGPVGLVGQSAAFPFFGGHKKLARGEPIFIDTGSACNGYYTDKTRIFSLGPIPQEAVYAHKTCLDIQEAVRSRLKPGALPSEIYEEVYEKEVLSRGFKEHFMGFGSNQVRFLGHGIGLVIDEFPAIAKKVKVPLEKNMVIALEPKKGLAGIGLVGIENTFLVTETGGEKLTSGDDAITIL